MNQQRGAGDDPNDGVFVLGGVPDGGLGSVADPADVVEPGDVSEGHRPGSTDTGDEALVSEPLRAALRQFDDTIAAARTRRMRLETMEVPDVEGPSAEELDEAARRPDAPRQMREMARAVDDGRASWSDVLTARVDAAPEVAALYADAPQRVQALIEKGDAETGRSDDGDRADDVPRGGRDDDRPSGPRG